MTENPREIVLDILMECESTGEYTGKMIKAVLDKYGFLDVRDKSFIKRLAEGTVERQITLDYYIDAVSKTPVAKMKPFIRNLLRLSTYQILYMDAVPDSAAVNEAVKLVDKRKFMNLCGFVNAVLRNISRKKDEIKLPEAGKNKVYALSVRYSCPEWIVKMWGNLYGYEVTEKMLEGLMGVHDVSIRLNGRLSADEKAALIFELTASCESVKQSKYLENVYFISGFEGVQSLPGFADGKFTVQDVSSCFVVELSGIKETDTVMDICAAPGGKSLYAAEKAGKVYSYDVSEYKTSLIEENVDRLKAGNVTVLVHDATQFDESREETADCMIADVPCSGLGIIGKKRDIKYNMSLEATKEINDLQKEILLNSYKYVKHGGTLVYSTCTINRAENDRMVTWITENLPFDYVDIRDELPKALLEDAQAVGNITGGKGFQFVPGFMESDGFFVAKFVRR